MNKINSLFSLFFAILLTLSSCQKQKNNSEITDELQYYHTQMEVFTTTASIKYSYHKDLGREIAARLDSFNLSLNPFNNQSIIYKVNNNIDVELDDWFINCFNKAQEIAEITDGYYDITAAPLINFWGFGFEKIEERNPQTIDSLKQYVGYEKIRLNGREIKKENPNVQLNMSSIAKGYACDVVAELFSGFGIENYMIEIGGEICAAGKNPKGNLWTIGITRPIDDSSGKTKETQEIVVLENRSLATSGNYRNFYLKDGLKYAHTINPKTGYPAQSNILSASVFYSDCMTADAYATAFMVIGLEKALEIADQIPNMDYLLIYTDEKGKVRVVEN